MCVSLYRFIRKLILYFYIMIWCYSQTTINIICGVHCIVSRRLVLHPTFGKLGKPPPSLLEVNLPARFGCFFALFYTQKRATEFSKYFLCSQFCKKKNVFVSMSVTTTFFAQSILYKSILDILKMSKKEN